MPFTSVLRQAIYEYVGLSYGGNAVIFMFTFWAQLEGEKRQINWISEISPCVRDSFGSVVVFREMHFIDNGLFLYALNKPLLKVQTTVQWTWISNYPEFVLPRNYWIFGLCPSSGILKTKEHNVSATGSVSVLRWEWETPTLVDSIERANLNHWKPVSV
jgi:hypothetical protein